MIRLRNALICLLLASLIGLVVYALLLVREATAVVSALPAGLSGQFQDTRIALVAELRSARADLVAQLEEARKDVLVRSERQIVALRTDVMGQAEEIRNTADRRIGDTLARADTALASLEALRRDAEPTLRNTAAITDHVNEASAVLLRRDALPAQLLGLTAAAKVTLGQTAQAMRSVQNATPAMLATWQRIGDDISGTANNLHRLTKPRWYDRLLGYGLNGVVIYRSLNPATNLTIKGAEFVSSRP